MIDKVKFITINSFIYFAIIFHSHICAVYVYKMYVLLDILCDVYAFV